MPALAQSRSTLPHFSVALATIALTCSKFETSAPSATASPPALRISSTTASAGVSEPPVPLPAPVTIATRPSNLIVMSKIPGSGSVVMPGGLSPTRSGMIRASIKRKTFLISDGLPGQAGNDGWWLSEINQADPVGHQRGLFLALDFDGDIGTRLLLLRLAQLGFDKRKVAADARARAHWGNESQFIETVIHSHRRAFDHRHHLIRHDAHQRHGQESVRHRRAIRGFAFGALGIDMDELVVFDDVGKEVDPVLIDQMP